MLNCCQRQCYEIGNLQPLPNTSVFIYRQCLLSTATQSWGSGQSLFLQSSLQSLPSLSSCLSPGSLNGQFRAPWVLVKVQPGIRNHTSYLTRDHSAGPLTLSIEFFISLIVFFASKISVLFKNDFYLLNFSFYSCVVLLILLNCLSVFLSLIDVPQSSYREFSIR